MDTKSTYQDLLFPDSFKPRINIPVLVSIRVSGDAQNVSAITIVGTGLKVHLENFQNSIAFHDIKLSKNDNGLSTTVH